MPELDDREVECVRLCLELEVLVSQFPNASEDDRLTILHLLGQIRVCFFLLANGGDLAAEPIE